MRTSRWYVSITMLALLAMVLVSCAPVAAPPAATTAPAAKPAATTAPAAPAAPAATTAPAAPAATKAAATAPAAASTTAPAASGGKKVLRVAMYREMDTLNPFTSQMLGEVFHQVFEGLTMSNEKNSYFGQIAKEVPTTQNGGIQPNNGKPIMTWNLVEGITWHDGKPVTAEDVCFTFNWIVSDDGKLIYNQGDYKNIERCEVVSPYVVRFYWKNNFAKFGTLFEAVLPKHVLEGKTISTLDAFNRAPVGNGPYKFAEWKAGEYIRLVKNENYWRKGYPKFDEMIFYHVPDANTRLNGLRSGQYDIGQLNSLLIKEAQGIPGKKAEYVSQNSFYHFDYSLKSERGKKLFSDIKVRQAIFHAIDRESIAKDLFAGNVVVAHTPVHPSSPYHDQNVKKYNYDLNKAKQLMEEAGWKVGAGGIREKDGEKMSFSILTRSDSDRLLLTQAIQALLKPLGVDAKVESMEAVAYTNKWRTGDWETLISGWILPADPSFTRQYACNGSNNMTGTCDPDLDKLMDASDQALVEGDRKVLSFQAQEKLAEVAFQLPVFYVTLPFVMDEKFTNFKPNGTNMTVFWNAYEWDIAR